MTAARIAFVSAALVGLCVVPGAAQIPANRPPVNAPKDQQTPPVAGSKPSTTEDSTTGSKTQSDTNAGENSPDTQGKTPEEVTPDAAFQQPGVGPDLTAEQKASAEYSGPAVLSRGITASQEMNAKNMKITPQVGFEGVVNTGITGATLDANGKIPDQWAPGMQLTYGLAGTKLLKKDSLTLSFGGSLYHYPGQSNYDGTDNHLLLVWQHRLSKRITVGFSESVQQFNRNNLQISGVAAVDLGEGSLATASPLTEAFNGSVFSLLTQASVAYAFNSRLTLNVLGGGFLTRRRSTALYGNTGSQASMDLQYRLTRRMTVGAMYNYTGFDFTGIYGSTQAHGAGATFAYAFNRNTEFSSRLGGSRLESTSLGTTDLDPVLAAILGTSKVLQAQYTVRYIPDVAAQFRRQIADLAITVAYNRGLTPGNGVILTSIRQSAMIGFNYRAGRIWNFAASAGYDGLSGIGAEQSYGSYAYDTSVYRKIGRQLDWHFRTDYHRYSFNNAGFLRNGLIISSGIAWNPGDILDRLW